MSLFKFYKNTKEETEIYELIKNIFGYKPKNIFLFKLALCHKSIAKELKNGHKDSNERLEYLGDAVLSTIIASYLFKRYPYQSEGFLTEMRSKLVSRALLNKLSIKLGINKHVRSADNNFSKSINGDAFEALVGAIFLDKGYNFTEKIILKKIYEIHVDIDQLEQTNTNYKSQLIEWIQKYKKNLEFRTVNELNESKIKQFVVNVIIDQEVCGRGIDSSIKGAEQNAAEKACIKLGIIDKKNAEADKEEVVI